MQLQMRVAVLSRNEGRTLLVVTTALILQYLAVNLVDYPGMAAYYVPPLMWLAIFIYVYPKLRAGPLYGHRLLLLVLALSAVRVSAEAVMGVYTGFARNAASMSAASIMLTLYFAGAKILAYESARTLYASRLGRLGAPWIVAVSGFLAVFSLQPVEAPSLEGGVPAYIKFLDARVAPLLALNLFLTFLALWGGFIYAAAYQLLYLSYNTIMPVLPDLHWVLKTYTGVLIPLLGVMLIYSLRNTRLYTREEPISLRPLAWLMPAAVVLVLVSGVAGYRPFTIVSSSMEPTIGVGDMVVVDMDDRSLEVGDVAAYVLEGRVVVHRVVSASGGVYITKGDALDEADSWIVSKEMVVGKVIYTIPRLGLLPIYLGKVLAHARYLAVVALALVSTHLGISRYRRKRW